VSRSRTPSCSVPMSKLPEGPAVATASPTTGRSHREPHHAASTAKPTAIRLEVPKEVTAARAETMRRERETVLPYEIVKVLDDLLEHLFADLPLR
jgi:hypothetical protein